MFSTSSNKIERLLASITTHYYQHNAHADDSGNEAAVSARFIALLSSGRRARYE